MLFFLKVVPKCRSLRSGSCRGITLRGDRATEKVSICTCLLCAFPALRFAKCSLTVRPVQFRSPLAKIITTSKRKCARSCGVGDAVQGGGRCPKQYLSVLRGCISAHCANIQPHNLAFSVARSPTLDARFATSNNAYDRQPSQPRRRYDVFAMQHLDTPNKAS